MSFGLQTYKISLICERTTLISALINGIPFFQGLQFVKQTSTSNNIFSLRQDKLSVWLTTYVK